MKHVFRLFGQKKQDGSVKCCTKCGKPIGKDEFCRFCGNSTQQCSYVPREEVMQCVYGPPPIKREHVCPECGYAWHTFQMIDRENFCPKCGRRTKVTELAENMPTDDVKTITD